MVNWFNPFVWFANLRLRNEMERACDDLVIKHGTKPSEYALHLVELARTVQNSRISWATAAMAHRNSLKDRLVSILNPEMDRKEMNKNKVGLLALMIVLFLFPIAAFQPWVKAESPELNDLVDSAKDVFITGFGVVNVDLNRQQDEDQDRDDDLPAEVVRSLKKL